MFACMTLFKEGICRQGACVPASVAETYNGTGDVLVRLHGNFEDPYRLEHIGL